MFVAAIKEAAGYTRPIHTITRNYLESFVTPGTASIFFVNDEGCAITCKHVIDLIGNRQAINEHYQRFKREQGQLAKNNKYNQRLKALETAYNLAAGTVVEVQERFLKVSSEASLSYRWINHPTYDLSLLIFENFSQPLYHSHARFLKDTSTLEQGKFLCRLGFPFPEFSNFQYNKDTDQIEWTNTGQADSPRFPIEGMLTRHLAHGTEIMGLEMSTPGLRGQSGGPLFNQEGLVCGMQSVTNHLHMGFDMKNFEYKTSGHSIKVTNQPFLHVGHCIHADIIKQFLRDHHITFFEE